MRPARHLSVALLSILVVAACSQATAGWTYAPAPSTTPAPAASGSAAPGGSGSPAASAGPSASAAPGSAAPSGQLVVINITAQGIKYNESAITAPADTPFQIQFDNQDAGVPHNVAIRTGGTQGPEIFKGTVFSGVATHAYDIPALDAGSYAFVCDVHPTMTGTLTVQ
jgi:plastocyanin